MSATSDTHLNNYCILNAIRRLPSKFPYNSVSPDKIVLLKKKIKISVLERKKAPIDDTSKQGGSTTAMLVFYG